MINDSFLQTLGLARRAGKLFYGFDSVIEMRDTLNTVFVANGISDKTLKNLKYSLDKSVLNIITVEYDMETIGYAIGTKPVGIIGIADDGFSRLLIGKLK